MRRDSPLRRALVQVHLYGGLILGLYVLIIGLTGASLVFREEMEDGMIPRDCRDAPGPASECR
jgi:uncharacterized iron-regulated membrane protein